LITALLLLTACTPNEADFKSDVPTIEERISQNSELRTQIQSEIRDQKSEINLDVPFFSQAPDSDWGMPWQEACEEASVILAYYYTADLPLSKEKFKEEVYKLVDWEIENYGQYEHTNISQTAEMLVANYELSITDYELISNPSIEDLKNELAQGHAIIAPFAGRQLGNPFYSEEGPYYHMMVIKGYDEEHFITNDVGTKRGENFIYPYETLMSAMHEWHDEDINLGAKKVIVIKPRID
ncbi:C39 family peptidase, partial [Patescibacteria group bacterium]|nr:C39 family peptidase [Patescibacteria group bacterium]